MNKRIVNSAKVVVRAAKATGRGVLVVTDNAEIAVRETGVFLSDVRYSHKQNHAERVEARRNAKSARQAEAAAKQYEADLEEEQGPLEATFS